MVASIHTVDTTWGVHAANDDDDDTNADNDHDF